MKRPSVSVVVPSHGGAQRLPLLFEGFRRQTIEEPWELVIALDGVVDDSRDVIDAETDLPVKVVELPENRGRAAALNAGFERARGEVLVRCDDDLGVAPTFLESHVRAHRDQPSIGVVGLCRDVLGDSGYARCYGRPANERLRRAAYASDPSGWWKYWAANCSVTREVHECVGPYDEEFREYGWEDVDWGYRLHLLGVPVVLDPGLEVLHMAASSDLGVRVRRAFLGGRAHVRFDRKHGLERRRPVPHGIAQRLWTGATDGAARFGSADRFGAWAARMDGLLDRVPPRVGAQACAFLVEAAATAGYADESTGS